jgi:acyl-CoA thioester hydrolase
MAKPDAALLDPARYPFHCQIEARFSDLDANLHINNVAFTDLLQEGRVKFHHASGYAGHSAEMTSMVVSLGIEYLGQGYLQHPLDMYVAIGRVGRTSFLLNQLIAQAGSAIVFAQATLVCVGPEGPVEIPQNYRSTAHLWTFRA